MNPRDGTRKLFLLIQIHMGQDSNGLAILLRQFGDQFFDGFDGIQEEVFSLFFSRSAQAHLTGNQTDETDSQSMQILYDIGSKNGLIRRSLNQIGQEKRKIGLFAHRDDRLYAEGKVQFTGGESIVPHEVIDLHIKFSPQLADFFGIRAVSSGNRIEKIPRIHEKDVFFLLPNPFDKGGPPGQTAKQIIFSAAGFHFPLHI